MPKQTEPAPQISGLTTQARTAREAERQAPSDETLSLMPSLGDLAVELGVGAEYGASEEGSTEDETPTSADDGTEETAEEEPAAEDAETTDEESTEEEDATAEEETTEEDDDQDKPKDGMQKRIDKLTAQRTELTDRVAELEAELEAARANPDATSTATSHPLAQVRSAEDLSKAIKEARLVKDWALRNRHGGELPVQGGEPRSFDADEVANMLANAEATLDAAPDRQQWLDHQDNARQMGQQLAPNFYKEGTEHRKILKKVMAALPPAVRDWRPDIELLMVQALVGSAVLRGNAPKPGAINPKPTVSASRVPAAPGNRTAPKAPLKQVQQQKAQQAIRKTARGTEAEIASLVERFL